MNKKTALIIILSFTIVAVFDSTIVSFSSYSAAEASVSANTAIFISFSVIFVAISMILINSVRKSTSTIKAAPLRLGYFYGIMFGTQVLTVSVIILIIFQMLLLNEYSLFLLKIQTWLSHLSALIFLSSLVFLFVRWLTSKRSYAIMLYTISLSLVCFNLVVSLIYLDSYLSSPNPVPSPMVKPYPIVLYVTNYNVLSIESISPIFDALSVCSFLLMWIATAILLGHYRYRMGRIQYFSLMSIPLLYYLFPFQDYFSNGFLAILPSSPISFSILYVLLFSGTKQAGALLFSLAFWTASSLVHDERIRKSLLFSSIGIVMLFGSLQIAPLQYHVYPPYGLVTKAFVPLGAYLLFAGIFISAISISRDTEVRKEFYKNAESQLTLLKTIGVSQMERELETQVKSVEKRSKSLEEDIRIEPELEEEDIKEILRDVLNELYYSKGKREIQEP
jgi:hypothetical protein